MLTEVGEIGTLIHYWWECKMAQSTLFKSSPEASQKVKHSYHKTQ
jgi:hypothetical protein